MKSSPQTPPLIIAHRGCHYPGFNQNTLRSFKQVMAEGAGAIEFDVQTTADGTAVIVHNLDLSEVSTGSGKVKETDTNTLLTFFAGSLDNGRDRIPTLDEMFALMASCEEQTRPVMHLELKGEGSGKASAALMETWLGDGRLRERDFLISSFNPDELQAMRAAHPEIPRAFLCGAVLRKPLEQKVPELAGKWALFFGYPEEDYMMPRYLSMDSYAPLLAEHIKDPTQRNILSEALAENLTGACYNDTVLQTSAKLKAVSINTCWQNTPEAFVKKAHELGFKVLCYTINNPSDMETMVAMGIDGFFTDEFKTARDRFA